MKVYYIKTGDFSNMYFLCWVEQGSLQEAAAIKYGYERISRKDAISKCIAERNRRRCNQAFSSYADACIMPYDASVEDRLDHKRRYTTNDGYVYERITKQIRRKLK